MHFVKLYFITNPRTFIKEIAVNINSNKENIKTFNIYAKAFEISSNIFIGQGVEFSTGLCVVQWIELDKQETSIYKDYKTFIEKYSNAEHLFATVIVFTNGEEFIIPGKSDACNCEFEKMIEDIISSINKYPAIGTYLKNLDEKFKIISDKQISKIIEKVLYVFDNTPSGKDDNNDKKHDEKHDKKHDERDHRKDNKK